MRFTSKSRLLLVLGCTLSLISLVTGLLPQDAWSARSASVKEQPSLDAGDIESLQRLRLAIPVKGITPGQLRDTFDEGRGKRRHEALDILAPRGTPVIAASDGRVAKLFTSAAGGITVYQFDPEERFVFYYAHLERYADGLKEGLKVKRGDVLGYVGTTGNAPKNTPHLHFTISRVGAQKQWWKGTALNPYLVLAEQRVAATP